jgi:hypothetical protein
MRGMFSIQESYIICFQQLSSFVSSILVFSLAPPDFRQAGNLESCRIPDQPERVRCQKARILGQRHALSTQFGFVLASFFNALPLFSSTS